MTKLLDIESPKKDDLWLENLRTEALKTFRSVGLPQPKTEIWKYTKPRDLFADDFTINAPKQVQSFDVDLGFPAYKIEFFNGKLEKAPQDLPKNVSLCSILEAREKIGSLLKLSKYPFAALNTAFLENGIFLTIKKNTHLDKPLVLVNKTASGEENFFYNLRHLIVLEENASAEILEHYAYQGEEKSRYFCNIVSEIHLQQNAILHHYKVQEEAFKACHLALNLVNVGRNAHYDACCIQKGGNLARNESKILLSEESAQANMNCAYLMNGWATIDNTTYVKHLAPHTFSDQLVKGVVGGNAKGVFQGKIHIAKDCVKVEGNQLHRALLLSDTAEIDCKPELEIFADDVRCTHGAATGVLDEMQLFYMQSRGINEKDAKQMLIDAYLDDVINKIYNNDIKDWIKNRI
ncbi:MAG: Fe-S cluster assembly protein SufD [Alphaproteobacteria bacterium]|nr:Fe-S cluster assembly protein SufD [Alphaproteobacteria bacterium]